MRPAGPAAHRANALCPTTVLSGANEVLLERPDRRRGPAANAGLLVDVLDMAPDGLGGDAETLGDLLVVSSAHQHQENSKRALGQPGRHLARSVPHAVAGGREHRV